jgi:hypothetical protein
MVGARNWLFTVAGVYVEERLFGSEPLGACKVEYGLGAQILAPWIGWLLCGRLPKRPENSAISGRRFDRLPRGWIAAIPSIVPEGQSRRTAVSLLPDESGQFISAAAP